MTLLQVKPKITSEHARNLFLNSCCIVVALTGSLFWIQAQRLYIVDSGGTRVSFILVHATEIFTPTQVGRVSEQERFGGAGATPKHGFGVVGAGVEGAGVEGAGVEGTVVVKFAVVGAIEVCANKSFECKANWHLIEVQIITKCS